MTETLPCAPMTLASRGKAACASGMGSGSSAGRSVLGLLLGAGLLMASGPAFAHVTFATKEVKAGEVATFVLKIPHGCAGAATTELRVSVPAVLSAVAPQDKAGWTVSVTSGTGTSGADGAAKTSVITWTGGSIPAEEHATFAFRAKVSADARDRVYVPIVQQCGASSERWIQIPKRPSDGEPAKPAPAFDIRR